MRSSGLFRPAPSRVERSIPRAGFYNSLVLSPEATKGGSQESLFLLHLWEAVCWVWKQVCSKHLCFQSGKSQKSLLWREEFCLSANLEVKLHQYKNEDKMRASWPFWTFFEVVLRRLGQFAQSGWGRWCPFPLLMSFGKCDKACKPNCSNSETLIWATFFLICVPESRGYQFQVGSQYE